MPKISDRSALLAALALAIGAALAAPAANADVYRWIDAQGRVQFSDRPVPGAERVSTSNRLPGSAATPAAPPAQAPAPPAATPAPQAVSAATQEAVQQDVAGARAEQCRAARERYDKAVRARRMFHVNASGQREYLSDADANTARVTAKATVDQACAPS